MLDYPYLMGINIISVGVGTVRKKMFSWENSQAGVSSNLDYDSTGCLIGNNPTKRPLHSDPFGRKLSKKSVFV